MFENANLPTGLGDYKSKRKDYWGVFIQTTPQDKGEDSFEFRKKWYGSENDAKRMSDDLKNKTVFIKWGETVYKLQIKECPNTKRDHWWVRCTFTYSKQF